MNERLSLSDLINFPFELYLPKHSVFLASTMSENQKAADLFEPRFFKNRSWYHSMDMHRISDPVKFYGGFSISILRNKQILTKKKGGDKKSTI
jgi:hypothetical protein